MIGGGKPCGPRTDNGHLLFPWWQAFNFNFAGIKLIRGKTLKVPDRYRIINLTPAARILATVWTNPAEYTGKGQVFHDNFKGVFVFSLADHLDISLDVQARGTRQTAGSPVCFLNCIGTGYGLRIKLKSGLSVGKTHIVFVV
jgi:hypothetical protein